MIHIVSRHTSKEILACAGLLLVMALILLPLFMTVFYSFETPEVIVSDMRGIERSDYGRLKVFPERASLRAYSKLLLDQTAYIRYFLNSFLYGIIITIGQVVISAMAAYALSCFAFRSANWIFMSYLLLMLLPFQTTMVPNFMLLREIRLLDTAYAIILPSFSSPFIVFLFRQFMVTIPKELLEASTIDGAHAGQIFLQVVCPICIPSIATAVILSFSESWNMVEQPLVYLSSARLFPLSLPLSRNEFGEGLEFAASTLFLLPTLFLFMYFNDEFDRGIQVVDLK